MPDKKSPDRPPAKRNKTGVVQSDTESSLAKRTSGKKSPKVILPPNQMVESLEIAESVTGEAPLVGPMPKPAIDPKMTMQAPAAMQVPAAVHEMAARTIDQAKKAFDMFFDAANKSLGSIRSPGTEISKQALALADRNIKAAFDHTQKLIQATNLQQAMQIQSEFLKSQFANLEQVTRKIPLSGKDASKSRF